MWGLQNFVTSIISLLLIATPTIRSTISSGNDWLYNTSVQDILSSGIGLNDSEKILEKIIDTAKNCASDCLTQKKISIDLSAEGFKFPESHIIRLDLGSHEIRIDDIRVSELSPMKKKLLSTSIKCQSSKMFTIEVKLSKDLEISARWKVLKIKKSTSESEGVYANLHEEGSISLILKDNSISKQFYIHEDGENIKWKLFHSRSVISIDVPPELQIPIHNKLQTILDEVKSPLRRFLSGKFDVEFAKNGIAVADVCSKFINADENLKKDNSQSRKNNVLSLYLIPRTGLSFGSANGREYFSKSGPIIIDGLSSFNSTEFILSEKKPSNSNGSDDYYFFTTPAYDDEPEMKLITIKIKTNELKGKVDMIYNSEPFSVIFTVEFVEFEVCIENTYQYENKSANQTYYDKSGKQHYYPDGSYTRSNRTKVELQSINVIVGEIQTKLTNVSLIKNNYTRKIAASEHALALHIDIRYQLGNTLLDKLNVSLFANCP